MENDNKCYVCGTEAQKQPDYEMNKAFYSCPVCGRYELVARNYGETLDLDLNQLGSYLVYNGFRYSESEYRYYTTMSKEWCDEWKAKFAEGNNEHGHPVHLSVENVENWYPKTFSEKIDYILLYVNDHTKHVGENLKYLEEELYSILFVERYDWKNGEYKKRNPEAMKKQVNYMLNYLDNFGYIDSPDNKSNGYIQRTITLTPVGYARVDMLQKNTSNGKKVLVAMKFGEETNLLREAIRKGIGDAGYIATFIDEVQHNDFITPELLKHIRDSKFVVVDLTHQNNGAYFEEGYAMGLGKPVIQLCQRDVQLHFDIAQKNTIMWENESDIAERLKNRIIATID